MDDKRAIRRQISKKRRQLEKSAQIHASNQASRLLQQLWIVQRSERLAFYAPFKGEISPLPAMNQALAQHKTCYLPVLDPVFASYMLFCRYDPGTHTKRNHLGILEPNTGFSSQVPPWSLDAVIAPLVAFDDEGFRLGWGGGFYDNTFAFTREPDKPRPWLIGIAYEFQRVETLPHASHDVRLDLIVTDHRVVDPSNVLAG